MKNQNNEIGIEISGDNAGAYNSNFLENNSFYGIYYTGPPTSSARVEKVYGIPANRAITCA